MPFDAITGFTDPSVPFGFKLEPRHADEPRQEPQPRRTPAPASRPEAAPAPATPKSGALRPAPERASQKPAEAPLAAEKSTGPAGEAKVVSIDAFRKK